MNLSDKYYYLVNKNWLDQYKSKNNYNKISEIFSNFNDWSDYKDFKEKSMNLFTIKENEIEKEDNETNHDIIRKKINTQKDKLDKYKLNYSINGELIIDSFFKENISSSRDYPQLEVFIGSKNILILDEENDKFVYSYSLIQHPDNINNFYIEINNVLIFNDVNIIEEELKEIASNYDINNYLIKKNIDIKCNAEQNIYNSEGNKIGLFLNPRKIDESKEPINPIYYNLNQNKEKLNSFSVLKQKKMKINNNNSIDINKNNNFNENNINTNYYSVCDNCNDNFYLQIINQDNSNLQNNNINIINENSNFMNISQNPFQFFNNQQHMNNINDQNAENNNNNINNISQNYFSNNNYNYNPNLTNSSNNMNYSSNNILNHNLNPYFNRNNLNTVFLRITLIDITLE